MGRQTIAKRCWLELTILGLAAICIIFGIATNSGAVGAWMGGTAAAAVDPIVFLGAMAIVAVLRPSWLMIVASLAWAAAVGFFIVYFVRNWELLDTIRPNPISFTRLSAAVLIASLASIIRKVFSSSVGDSDRSIR
jgi:hypothetical protein